MPAFPPVPELNSGYFAPADSRPPDDASDASSVLPGRFPAQPMEHHLGKPLTEFSFCLPKFSICLSLPKFSICLSLPKFFLCMSLPEFSVCLSPPELSVCLSLP